MDKDNRIISDDELNEVNGGVFTVVSDSRTTNNLGLRFPTNRKKGNEKENSEASGGTKLSGKVEKKVSGSGLIKA
ncbi:MAG: hypothetical protein K6B28_08260 [Lachnospiraceae bacterium]|nr:hypothetical protein [Lachnospiraceae bacterium]